MNASAATKESRGRTACHGSAVVAMSTSDAAASATIHGAGDGPEPVRDAAVAGDARDDLDEDRGCERHAECEAEDGPTATPHGCSLGSGPARTRC